MNDALLQYGERAAFDLRALYRRYGYSTYKMSKFEEYDLYVRNKSFLVCDRVITFTERDGRLMALKPDVTLSIIKNTAGDAGALRKVCYNENVYRAAPGAPFREIMQSGLECLGAVDDYCVSEVLTLALESLSLIADKTVLDVSHLGLLSEVIGRMNADDETAAKLPDCVGRKNLHDIDGILTAAGYAPETAAPLKALMNCVGAPADVLPRLFALYADAAWQAAVQSFADILGTLDADRVRVDFSVVNDMNYYNGIVFQGFAAGIPESVLSGGQYDRLMRRMGKAGGAIGFAVYLDLLEALSPAPEAYDADVLLLYPAGFAPARVKAAVDTLTADGSRVLALTAEPEKMTFGKRLILTESGVCEP